MTRSNKKQKEYDEILHPLLCSTGIQPRCGPLGSENPDFMMQISDRMVGVEVTMFQSDKTVTCVGRRVIKRRAVESEWERFEKDFKRKHADLKGIYILFRFKNIIPPQQEYDVFFQEILEFVRSILGAVSEEFMVFGMSDFPSSLMKKYLKPVGGITLRRCDGGEFDSNMTAGFVDSCPARTISKIVVKKTAKAYRKADELWLVIGQSGRPSEMVLPISGSSEFNACLDLQESLSSSPFSRVYCFTAGGLLQWNKRDGKWASGNPSGDHPLEPGADSAGRLRR